MFEGTLPESTRAILRRLSPIVTREGFYLAGGSGLALQISHKISEDLDFFSQSYFDPSFLLSLVREGAKALEEIRIERDTLIIILDGVRLSFYRYEVPLLFEPIMYEQLKVADWRDIAAEKFKTIAQRGLKKDFYDLYAVLQSGRISIEEIVSLLKKRFESTGLNLYHVLRSLTYFEDADKEPDPKLIERQGYSWDAVKSFFLKNIKEFERSLIKG